jgi:hypothetical protein
MLVMEANAYSGSEQTQRDPVFWQKKDGWRGEAEYKERMTKECEMQKVSLSLRSQTRE